MIKLDKCPEPNYLATRAVQWTTNLNNAVNLYGSYDAIPKKEKDSLTEHYRHQHIKDALFPTSFNKCAFCECIPEDGGNFIQIEHYFPKSIYPSLCFSWDNFLPSCNKCNLAKSILDTVATPIINPYVDEPSQYLYVSLLKLKTLNGSQLGSDTIKELKLNSSRHINARRDLLADIEKLTERLQDKIDEFNHANTQRLRDNRLGELQELLEELDFFMRPDQPYSFFCKQIILNEPEYIEAKGLI
ncbi:hypothetical protein R2200_002023 [Cronobacter malonaticus]|nr:hypothetical protein [Cronobacter malonaticus]ELQ6067234.1 hypothetical protein [Cronobacter malonaticus]